MPASGLHPSSSSALVLLASCWSRCPHNHTGKDTLPHPQLEQSRARGLKLKLQRILLNPIHSSTTHFLRPWAGLGTVVAIENGCHVPIFTELVD